MAKRPYNTKREKVLRTENALLDDIVGAYKHAVRHWGVLAERARESGNYETLAVSVLVGGRALEKYFGAAEGETPAVVREMEG